MYVVPERFFLWPKGVPKNHNTFSKVFLISNSKVVSFPDPHVRPREGLGKRLTPKGLMFHTIFTFSKYLSNTLQNFPSCFNLTNDYGYLTCTFVFSTPGTEQIQKMWKTYKISTKRHRGLSDGVKQSIVYGVWHRSGNSLLIFFFNYGLFTHHMSNSYHNTLLLWRHPTHSTHAFNLKRIGDINTQCRSDMMSFSCNWDNHSKVKMTISFFCCEGNILIRLYFSLLSVNSA